LDPEKKLPMPKRTQILLQYFTPPNSERVPGIEDLIIELQDQLDDVKNRQDLGDSSAQVPQPYLGSMIILRAWLTDSLFKELMEIR